MNYKTILSLTFAISIPAFAAESAEERQYKREKEAKEQSKKESEQAALLEAAAEKPVPTQTVDKPYPKTQQRLKDLQAKIERLGKEEITQEERLKLSTADLESEIRKRGTKKLSEDERLLLDTLMFGELGEAFGGVQGMMCEYLTGWHEVGQLKGHNGVVNALTSYTMANCMQDEILISGGQDGTVKIWDIGTWKLRHTLPAYTDPRVEGPLPVAALTIIRKGTEYHALIPDILAVAYRAPGSSGMIKLFKLHEKKAPTLIKTFNAPFTITHLHGYENAAHKQKLESFSPAGDKREWDIETGGFTQLPAQSPTLVPWNATQANLFAWNLAAGAYQCIKVPAHTPVAFSNPLLLHYSRQKENYLKELFATGDINGTIYVWDTKNPECVTTISGHTAKITALRFVLPIGLWIEKFDVKCVCPCPSCEATNKEDKDSIAYYGSSHCTPCKEIRAKALEEMPDTIQLVSASEDGTVRLWEMSEGTKVLPALITEEKEFAENPNEEGCGCTDEYTNPECACPCHEECDSDSDIEEEKEKVEKEEKEKLDRNEPVG